MPESDEEIKIQHPRTSPILPNVYSLDDISDEDVMQESDINASNVASPIDSATSVMPDASSPIESIISIMPESPKDNSLHIGYLFDSDDHSSAVMPESDAEVHQISATGPLRSLAERPDLNDESSERHDSDVMPESEDEAVPQKFVEIENMSGSTFFVQVQSELKN